LLSIMIATVPHAAPTAPGLMRQDAAAVGSACSRRLNRWKCRTLTPSAWAPYRLLIWPAGAARSSPGRGASFLLIVKVSMEGRPFHGAVTPRHFHGAAAAAAP
jgi:hypothetical protein